MRRSSHFKTATLALALLAFPGGLSGQSVPCQSGNLDTMLKKYNDACRITEGCAVWQAFKAAVFPVAAMNTTMRNWWNTMVGSSWATIGPRYFEFGVMEPGNVVTPTMRTFYSLLPSSGSARTISVKHIDGKSRTILRVCTVDPTKGTPAQVGSTIDIPRGATLGKSYTFKATSADRQFVIVEIDPKTYGRSFKYELTVR